MLYIILLLVLRITSSYPQASQYLRNAESGTVTVQYYQQVTTMVNIYQKYDLSFKKAFINNPKYAFGIESVLNCPIKYHYFILVFSINVTTSSFKAQFMVFSKQFTFVFEVKSSYIFVDQILNPWFNSIQRYQNSSINVFQQTLPVSNALSNFYCFPLSFYQHQVDSLPYNVITSCYKNNPNQITFKFITTASIPAYNVLRVKYFLVTIDPQLRGLVSIRDGPITATASQNLPLTYSPSNVVSSIFLVGLTQVSSTKICINFTLNPLTRNQVQQTNNFHSIKYNHVLLYEPYISPVKSFVLLSQISFIFVNSGGLQILTSSTLNTPLNYKAANTNILVAQLISPITTNSFDMIVNFKKGTKIFPMPFSFKLITSNSLIINTLIGQYNLIIINIQNTIDKNNFQLEDSNIIITNVYTDSNGVNVIIKHNQTITGNQFTIKYRSTDKYISNHIILPRPVIVGFKFSVATQLTKLNIAGITNIATAIWISNNIFQQGFTFLPSTNNIEINFNYSNNILSILEFNYKPNPSRSDFTVYFNLDLITVKYIQLKSNTRKCKITLTNIAILKSVSLLDFVIPLQGLKLQSISIKNSDIIIQAQYLTTSLDVPFQIFFFPQQLPLQVTITDLKIIERFINFTFDSYQHWINFTFIKIETSNVLPQIVLMGQYISFHSKQFIEDTLVVYTQFIRSLNINNISFILNSQSDLIFQQILSFQFENKDFWIKYCVSRFQKITNQYTNMSIVLVIIYWGIFILCMFLCLKIFAIELIFTIQFVYMTLIPIGIQCEPFIGLEFLKYSFGWNKIPFSLIQVKININYIAAGVSSNFLSNLNFTIFILALCPIIYLIMVKAADHCKHYQTNPRLIVYGKSFLLDIPFTIILMNIPNICMSSIVSYQSFGLSNILSFVSSIISMILIAIALLIFLIFKQSFKEYKQEFCKRLRICKISISTSTKFKELYPVILLLQITIISIVLSLETLMNISVFISFGIIIFFNILILIVRPYNFTIDNVRLIVHRFFLLFLSGLQIGFKILNNEQIEKNSFVINYPWIVLITLLLVACGVNLPYLVFKSIEWIKKPNLKDGKLYAVQNPIKQKQFYPNNTNKHPGPGKLYPAQQFSIYRSKQQKQVHKKLLEVPKLNNNRLNKTQI